MIIKKRKVKKIILFGGSIILFEVACFFKKKNYQIEVYSSNRLLLEEINSQGNLKKNLVKNNIYFVSTNNINKCDKLFKSINKYSIGLGFGETWSFSENIIKLFNGYLYDYMGIPLPRYRGGAHFTWMIMQEEKNNGACLQIINKDMVQGVFDSGAIIISHKFKNKKEWKPKDYFKAHCSISIKLINKFLNKISIKNMHAKKIKEKDTFFLPRLNTKINGWINWYSWDTFEIINFINAFDLPYIGASSLINNKNIYLRNAKIINKSKFHSFQNGIICKKNKNNSADIITKNGIINVDIYSSSGKHFNFIQGDRIYSPIKKIELSMSFIPEYNSDGIVKK